MVASFSSIDMTTRMEIKDLMSRFCHALDHNKVEAWNDLFRPDATVIAPRFGVFHGREETSTIPKYVADDGGGAWRHIFNNIVIDCRDYKTYSVEAYCTVNDWRKRGATVRFWDFSATLIRKRNLQISRLEMCPVGQFCENPQSYVERAPAEMIRGPVT